MFAVSYYAAKVSTCVAEVMLTLIHQWIRQLKHGATTTYGCTRLDVTIMLDARNTTTESSWL